MHKKIIKPILSASLVIFILFSMLSINIFAADTGDMFVTNDSIETNNNYNANSELAAINDAIDKSNQASGLIITEISSDGTGHVFRISPSLVNAKNDTNKSVVGAGPWYIDLRINGANSTVYGEAIGYSVPKPHSLTLKLYSGTSSASTVKDSTTTISIGTTASPTRVSASTNSVTAYWKVTISGTVDGYGSVSGSTYTFVYNKIAQEYPYYLDSTSGIALAVPSPTWTKVTTPVPPLTTAQLQVYRVWYQNTYNNGAAMDWSNIEVHHQRPRAYGGTNDYSNLIPLPYSFHRGTVTPWWVNYGSAANPDVD